MCGSITNRSGCCTRIGWAKRHFEITSAGAAGIDVNGTPVRQAKLQVGDVIRIGDCDLVFTTPEARGGRGCRGRNRRARHRNAGDLTGDAPGIDRRTPSILRLRSPLPKNLPFPRPPRPESRRKRNGNPRISPTGSRSVATRNHHRSRLGQTGQTGKGSARSGLAFADGFDLRPASGDDPRHDRSPRRGE